MASAILAPWMYANSELKLTVKEETEKFHFPTGFEPGDSRNSLHSRHVLYH